ncbi:uncharacterized protein [Rutidosis leptorrhynchoides]|uniref:uncharacterized protein n=1 Tax=Rutidosis leptorrhynchoides TaxID=125765 RepID=UPI003A99B0F8
MAGAFIYQIFTSTSLFSVGLYHIISTTRNFLRSPQSFSAKPYHPFPASSSSPSSSSPSSSSSTHHHQNRFLKHTQLYLTILCLLIALTHQILLSTDSDPLLKGRTPVHRLISLQSFAVILLFLILAAALLLSDAYVLPLPSDLFFALAAAAFFLQYSVSSSDANVQISDLQAKCDSVFARISLLASGLCLILSLKPNLFIFDVGFGGSICLLGLWELQTGLSLYVDAFIPEGCHKLLDVTSGVEGSTKCDLEESKLRAVAILDLMFLFHVMVVLLLVMISYVVVAKCIGIRRLGSYEALSTTINAADSTHIQMKALTGTQA